MRCHGVTIPGSDSRFFIPNNLTPRPTNLNPTTTTMIFSVRVPKPVYSTRNRSGSVKAEAAVNGAVVAEAAVESSFYELLGIPETGSLVEIKQAYKQLARKYHPDVSPPGRVEEYTRRFIRVQEAYETLSDPCRRALYDRDMAKGLHLAFSARRRYQNNQGMEEKSEWKNRWQSQLSELKRRSMSKDGRGNNMSWGARMRRRNGDLSNDL
ncbi:chaperone protein dnaJ 20, chloroplastic-like [Humulus lupulus]|uniref:chaperone protein dnaJ 20, chloroplastic-like n=1 Tax=Humulus lupulus TaxID=3486 RepID=UPI002B402041|nr:chaperone protein dnaJ 20, chloroplastic-like [Humulus lupulus]